MSPLGSGMVLVTVLVEVLISEMLFDSVLVTKRSWPEGLTRRTCGRLPTAILVINW